MFGRSNLTIYELCASPSYLSSTSRHHAIHPFTQLARKACRQIKHDTHTHTRARAPTHTPHTHKHTHTHTHTHSDLKVPCHLSNNSTHLSQHPDQAIKTSEDNVTVVLVGFTKDFEDGPAVYPPKRRSILTPRQGPVKPWRPRSDQHRTLK